MDTRGNGPGPWAHRLRLLRRFLFRPRSLRGGWPGGLRIHVGPVVRSLGAVGEGQRPVDAFVRHPDAPLPVAKDRGKVTGTRGRRVQQWGSRTNLLEVIKVRRDGWSRKDAESVIYKYLRMVKQS